jgi:hypothetical protein
MNYKNSPKRRDVRHNQAMFGWGVWMRFWLLFLFAACHHTTQQPTPHRNSPATPIGSIPISAPVSLPVSFSLEDVDAKETINGITIQYLSRNHMEGAGYVTGVVSFTFTKQGKTESHSISGKSSYHYGEWIFSDHLIIAKAVANSMTVSITVLPGVGVEPLDWSAATELLEKEAARRGLVVSGSARFHISDGILKFVDDKDLGWFGQMGLLSREIYELRAREGYETYLP